MRFLLLAAIFATSAMAATTGGLGGSYIRLEPTTLPAVCRIGDLRINTATSVLSICGATNTWSAISALGNPVSIANGGTGQATKQASFDSLSPLAVKGDLIAYNGTHNVAFGVGVDGTVLTADSTQGSGLKWTAPLVNPMTTLGDLIYESAAPAAARLAGSTSATKQFLTQTGNGSVSAAPAWGSILNADLPTTISGITVKLPDGTSGAPSLTFASDTTNGLYRIGANHWGLSVGGAEAVDLVTSTGSYGNVGLGGGASVSDNYPLLILRTLVGTIQTQLSNGDTNAGSGTKFQVFADAGNNQMEIAAFTAATAAPDIYAGGRGVVRAGGLLGGLTLVADKNSSADVKVYAGGDNLANKIATFNSSGLTLGVSGTLTGALNLAGATSGTVTIQPQAAAGTYNFNLPTTAGTAGNVLTSQGGGSNAMTWTAPTSNPYNYTSQTTTYSAVINDWVLASGASFTITLPTAVGLAGKTIIIQHNGTSLSQVYTLNTTSAQTIGGIASGSYKLYTNGEVVLLLSDGANWQVAQHQTATAPISYTPSLTGGWGTATSVTYTWTRRGSWMRVEGAHVNGTVATGNAVFPLPAGASIDTGKIWNSTSTNKSAHVGFCISDAQANAFAPMLAAVLTSATQVYLGGLINASAMLIPTTTANTVLGGSSDLVSVEFEVPISGWQP